MGAKPSRSHWPTVRPPDKMCPILTCMWSPDERGMGSVGERPVSLRGERRWTPSPLTSRPLWLSLHGLVEARTDHDAVTANCWSPGHPRRSRTGSASCSSDSHTRCQRATTAPATNFEGPGHSRDDHGPFAVYAKERHD